MKHHVLYLILSLCLLLAGCSKGNVSNVQFLICESAQYTQAEIQDAMDVAVSHFKKEFEGCTLLTMEYSEAKTASSGAAWAAQYGAEEGIILLSSFDVDENGGDGGFNPNSTYTNWQWILTRSEGGKWELQTWGYG